MLFLLSLSNRFPSLQTLRCCPFYRPTPLPPFAPPGPGRLSLAATSRSYTAEDVVTSCGSKIVQPPLFFQNRILSSPPFPLEAFPCCPLLRSFPSSVQSLLRPVRATVIFFAGYTVCFQTKPPPTGRELVLLFLCSYQALS